MIEAIDYIVKGGEVTICRCLGEGAYVEVPSAIEGLPVKHLADHCFAPEASVRIPQHLVRRWHVCGTDTKGKTACDKPLCGDGLEEIILPEGLVSIGDYAFYSCDHLERLYLPGSVRRLGSGCLVAANHIREFHFGCHVITGNEPNKEVIAERINAQLIKDVISETSYEVEVIVEDDSGSPLLRLMYPEYYEESIENTPARLINMSFEGTGYRYRQCFRDGKIDFAKYDSLFYTASVQEYVPTVMQLIFDRLQTPVELTEKAKETYISYLKQESAAAAGWVLTSEHVHLLSVLIEAGYFSEGAYCELGRGSNTTLDRVGQERQYAAECRMEEQQPVGAAARLNFWLDQAAARGQTEAVSRLMELGRKRSAGKKRKYEW